MQNIRVYYNKDFVVCTNLFCKENQKIVALHDYIIFNNKNMRSFGSFTFEDVEDIFYIKKEKSLSLLTEWLSAELYCSEYEKYDLNKLKDELLLSIYNWNEDELKMFFIGPLIRLANMETEAFKPFTQRLLTATIDGIEVNGRVDFMIAKGRRTAKPPYFCIHEYKQEVDKEGDPMGQVLIAMLAAQTLNEKAFPMLGAYIIGRNWFFVVLDGNQYAVSKEYDASDTDIFQIFAILQKSKEIMMRHV